MARVDPCAPQEQTYWLVQPLVDAGLPLEEISALVSRLGFEAVVGRRQGLDDLVLGIVGDLPRDVRAAWVETVSRMIELPASGG